MKLPTTVTISTTVLSQTVKYYGKSAIAAGLTKYWAINYTNGIETSINIDSRNDNSLRTVIDGSTGRISRRIKHFSGYVIATGETHSVREFLEEAFSQVGLDWQKYVVHDSRYLRPTEVDLLVGDPSKAREQLGWKARTTFKQLVKLMVEADIELLKAHQEGRIKVPC